MISLCLSLSSFFLLALLLLLLVLFVFKLESSVGEEFPEVFPEPEPRVNGDGDREDLPTLLRKFILYLGSLPESSGHYQ